MQSTKTSKPLQKTTGYTGPAIALSVMMMFSSSMALAQSDSESDTNQYQGLQVPSDLKTQRLGNREIEELRIGGRLDRLTVRHDNGLTEVFENDQIGDLWLHEDDELGQKQKIRKWTITSW